MLTILLGKHGKGLFLLLTNSVYNYKLELWLVTINRL